MSIFQAAIHETLHIGPLRSNAPQLSVNQVAPKRWYGPEMNIELVAVVRRFIHVSGGSIVCLATVELIYSRMDATAACPGLSKVRCVRTSDEVWRYVSGIR